MTTPSAEARASRRASSAAAARRTAAAAAPAPTPAAESGMDALDAMMDAAEEGPQSAPIPATVAAPAQATRTRSTPPPAAPVTAPTEELDEAFGPDATTGAPQPRNASGGSPTQGGAQMATPRAATGGAMSLPMADDPTRKIDTSDIVMPKLKVCQAMSKANTEYSTSKGKSGVPMGNWYHSTKNVNYGDTVYFIPADMRKTRAMFVQGQGLMCRSFDMRNGEGDPGGSCEGTFEEIHLLPETARGCPLRLWMRDPATKSNTPPKCGVTYNYPGLLIADIDDPEKTRMEQVVLQFRSTATQAAKTLNTVVMSEGEGQWANVILEMTLDTRTNPKGTFFVPVVDFFERTNEPEYERLGRRARALSQSLGGVNMRASLEADTD